MPHMKKTQAIEITKEERLKKESAYLQRQFPWKSQDEIDTMFSEQGKSKPEALRKLRSDKVVMEHLYD